MKFQFRLEKLLHFLHLRETMKKMEVSALLQKIGLLEREKIELAETMRSLLVQQMEKLKVGTEWLFYQTKKIEWDAREAERLEKLLSRERQTLEDKQYELSRISMRKKALESLKAKRMTDFKLEQSRKAQKQLDQTYQLLRGKNS